MWEHFFSGSQKIILKVSSDVVSVESNDNHFQGKDPNVTGTSSSWAQDGQRLMTKLANKYVSWKPNKCILRIMTICIYVRITTGHLTIFLVLDTKYLLPWPIYQAQIEMLNDKCICIAKSVSYIQIQNSAGKTKSNEIAIHHLYLLSYLWSQTVS